MKHVVTVSKEKTCPAYAESILVKQEQAELASDLIGIYLDLRCALKGEPCG